MQVSILKCKTRNKFPFNSLALIIMAVEKTNYSHYAIKIKFDDGKVRYYDSNAKGTMERPESEFRKQYKIVEENIFTKNLDESIFLIFWVAHVRKKYAMLQLFGYFFKFIKVFKKTRWGYGSKKLICNELVVLFLNFYSFSDVSDTDDLGLNDLDAIIYSLKRRGLIS